MIYDDGSVKLHYSREKKIAFLQSMGYEVATEGVRMSWSVYYHNDVESATVKVTTVRRNGEKFCRPGGSSFGKDDWLDEAFTNVFRKRLMHVLMQPVVRDSPDGITVVPTYEEI